MLQSNKKDFTGQKIAIGIDVHLRTWSVTVLTASGLIRTHSQKASAKELFEHLKKHYPNGSYHAAYETGFSGFSTYYALTELGIHCTVVHAADVPTTQKEQVSKSDPIDSKKLAKALMRDELECVYIHTKNNLDDRSLVRYRDSIVKQIGRTKSRIKHLLYNNGVEYPDEYFNGSHHWTRKFISWLQDDVRLLSETRMSLDMLIEDILHYRHRLLTVNRKLRTLALSDKYANKYELLMSIPGIGTTIAMSLLTEIDDIDRFSNQRQFASFLGLIPMISSSGNKEYVGEKTFRGNKQLGPRIVEASWISIRHDTELSAKYGSLCARGMKPQEAIIRIARKLVNVLSSAHNHYLDCKTTDYKVFSTCQDFKI